VDEWFIQILSGRVVVKVTPASPVTKKLAFSEVSAFVGVILLLGSPKKATPKLRSDI